MSVRHKLLWSAALLIAWFTASAQVAQACRCARLAPCAAYENASAVFAGTVTEIIVEGGEEATGGVRNLHPPKRVRFVIESRYRGVSGDTAEVKTGGSNCEYRFKRDERYLVYAYSDDKDGSLRTGMCSRTQPLSEAGEDLQYIRSLPDAEPGATVYGKLTHYRFGDHRTPPKEIGGLGGMTVVVEGEGGKYEARTNEQGEYAVRGVAAGKYKVTPVLPDHLYASELPREVILTERGCGAASYSVSYNGRIRGRVLDARGQPVPRASLNLILVDEVNSRRATSITAGTDAGGDYKLKHMVAGRYLLGIALSGSFGSEHPEAAYPRIYHPGVTDPNLATVIELEDGGLIENRDIRLPAGMTTRKISGTVLRGDGRRAAGAIVNLQVKDAPVGKSRYNIEANANGEFTFNGFSGLTYVLTAYINDIDKRGDRHADPVVVAGTGDATTVRLVINEPPAPTSPMP